MQFIHYKMMKLLKYNSNVQTLGAKLSYGFPEALDSAGFLVESTLPSSGEFSFTLG